MPCGCHTAEGLAVKVARPYDQCLLCARKHIKNAWGAFNEFTYEEDNRDYLSDQLRKAADHLKSIRRETALKCRDLAMQVEENRDAADMAAQLDALRVELREAVYGEHPDMAARLAQLRTVPDVIIPLGPGSTSDNGELRMLLRSIDAHLKNYGRVFLATDCAPDWLSDEVTVVEAKDTYSDNKDANLHRKTLRVLERHEVGDFVFCADDNVVMQDISAGAIPALVNGKDRSIYEGENLSKWQRRVKNTFAWAEAQGAHLEHHYEVHCPQLFHGAALRERLPKVDYTAQPGLTIYTTWRVLTDTWRDALPQAQYKTTMENECGENLARMSDAELCARPFLGYNDGGVKCGILDRLAKLFPSKSRFER